jgi:DNA-binding LacI/PurR family transcriptional regulator
VDLTSVSQDARKQAQQAIALAADRLETGRSASREIVLAPHLVIRSNTGPPRLAAVPASGPAQPQPA